MNANIYSAATLAGETIAPEDTMAFAKQLSETLTPLQITSIRQPLTFTTDFPSLVGNAIDVHNEEILPLISDEETFLDSLDAYSFYLYSHLTLGLFPSFQREIFQLPGGIDLSYKPETFANAEFIALNTEMHRSLIVAAYEIKTAAKQRLLLNPIVQALSATIDFNVIFFVPSFLDLTETSKMVVLLEVHFLK